MSIFTADEIEVWTKPLDDGDETQKPYRWGIRIDGIDHGGGDVVTHWHALRDATNYLRDLAATDKEDR